MKVVDLVARIPEHLNLNFSDFLRISRHFQSLLFWKTKEKGKEILHLDPWTSISSPRGSLAELRAGEGLTAPFPARSGPGGEGEVGGKCEGARAHLWVVVWGLEVVCSGGAKTSSGPAAN